MYTILAVCCGHHWHLCCSFFLAKTCTNVIDRHGDFSEEYFACPGRPDPNRYTMCTLDVSETVTTIFVSLRGLRTVRVWFQEIMTYHSPVVPSVKFVKNKIKSVLSCVEIRHLRVNLLTAVLRLHTWPETITRWERKRSQSHLNPMSCPRLCFFFFKTRGFMPFRHINFESCRKRLTHIVVIL